MGEATIRYCDICGAGADRPNARLKLTIQEHNQRTDIWVRDCCEECTKKIKELSAEKEMKRSKAMKDFVKMNMNSFAKNNKRFLIGIESIKKFVEE